MWDKGDVVFRERAESLNQGKDQGREHLNWFCLRERGLVRERWSLGRLHSYSDTTLFDGYHDDGTQVPRRHNVVRLKRSSK